MILDALVDEPINEELRLLQTDGQAAAEFLLACVPLDLDSLVAGSEEN